MLAFIIRENGVFPFSMILLWDLLVPVVLSIKVDCIGLYVCISCTAVGVFLWRTCWWLGLAELVYLPACSLGCFGCG